LWLSQIAQFLRNSFAQLFCAETCAVSLTESTGVHSVAGSFIGAAQGPIPQDISWKYAGAVQVGGARRQSRASVSL